jgi:hypothetical protein
MCRRPGSGALRDSAQNAERRDKVLEACKGKQGEVLRSCMREEYKKLGPAPKP